MKVRKSYLYYLIFIIFVLYGLNSYIFERLFYFNEILAFGGAIIFYKNVVYDSKKTHILLPKSRIYKLILLLLALCILHLLISAFTKTNWYFYLRNSVIFYSIFSFFIGFYSLSHFREFLVKAKIFLRVYVLYGLIFPLATFMDRFTVAVFTPFLFGKVSFASVVGIIILDLLLAKQYESMTVALVTFIVAFLLLIPNYRYFKVLSIVAFLGIVLGFIYFTPNLKLYKMPPYSLFGNTHAVMNSHSLLGVDGNSTWRAVFWYRIAVERFPENLVGIGFGTPIFDYLEGLNTVVSAHEDRHDIHVSGSHNTYLTLSLRLGLAFVFIIVLIFRNVFREFYFFRSYYLKSKLGLIFLSFISVSVIGFFNLLLESPMGAALFWCLLGFVASAIHERKLSEQKATLLACS